MASSSSRHNSLQFSDSKESPRVALLQPVIFPGEHNFPLIGSSRVKTVDMHTTGEPTRIVYAAFPALGGTLLEQRAEATSRYDHVRRSLMQEPRGHRDMYGAILEKTQS